MKIVWKLITAICTAAFAGGVAAAVWDIIQRRKEERKAKVAGACIHQTYGIYERYFKRFFDFFLSALALVGLSPVLLVTALLVRVKLGKPVLFVQKRPGKNEKIFSIYKLRTMTDQRDENGELLPDEKRLTAFGKMLRSTSLDELPELINILKGDMSIVGPRPLLVEYLPYYNEKEKQRHNVRPGLTGLAQVNGRNHLNWNMRFEADVAYVNHVTFIQDMKIILNTVGKVLSHSDVLEDTSKGEINFAVERRTEIEEGMAQ